MLGQSEALHWHIVVSGSPLMEQEVVMWRPQGWRPYWEELTQGLL